MYLLFWVLWMILNGQLTWEIAILGFIVAGVIYTFMCKFMDFSFKKDLFIFKRAVQIIYYILILVWEIVKANVSVLCMVFSSKYDLEPVIVHFRTDLKSRTARVVLANSITLTPGTITVSLEDDKYVVHCLDKDLAKGIDSSVFVSLLKKMEEGSPE